MNTRIDYNWPKACRRVILIIFRIPLETKFSFFEEQLLSQKIILKSLPWIANSFPLAFYYFIQIANLKQWIPKNPNNSC